MFWHPPGHPHGLVSHPAPPTQPALEDQKQIVPIRVIPGSIPSDSNAEETVEDYVSVSIPPIKEY
eukprot:1146294-Amphidinium_carterae.1